MYEGFLLNPNGPQGATIRSQLDIPYYWIPYPFASFTCRWHRLEKAGLTGATVPPDVDLNTSDTGETDSGIPFLRGSPSENALACEGCFQNWPEGVAVELLTPGFPLSTLPDGRQVFFIPDVPQMGPFTPKTYRRLVASAEGARPSVTRHAYEVALGTLQLWRQVGPAMGRVREVETHSNEFWDILHEVDPSHRNRKFEQWIFHWARDLYDNPSAKFVPSEEALKVLSRATGLSVSGVESAMWRKKKRTSKPEK